MAGKDIRKVISGLIQTINDQHTATWTDLTDNIKQTETILKSIKELKKSIQQKMDLNKEVLLQGKKDAPQGTLKDKLYERKTYLELEIRKLESRIAGYADRITDLDKGLKLETNWDSKWKGTWPAQKKAAEKELTKIKKSFQLLSTQKMQETSPSKLKTATESDEEALRKLEAYVNKFDKTRKVVAVKLDDWDRELDTYLGIPSVLEEPYMPYTAALPPTVVSTSLHLGKKLGGGAFGEVHKVNEVEGAPSMAFKYFAAKKGGGIDEAELDGEIGAYEKVGEHPNVAKCFGRHTVDGKDGMVMEFMDGGTLSDVFEKLASAKKSGEVSEVEYWAASQHMMKGLLQALAHMDKVGFVHSDLKPANIGFARGFETKVFDLGAGGDTASKFKTSTPAYLDPGQMKTLDPSFDIFSTGHMVHELMEGKNFNYHKKGGNILINGYEFIQDTGNRVLIELDNPEELYQKIKDADKELGRELKELKKRAENKEIEKDEARREGVRLIKERDEKVMKWWEDHGSQYNKYQTEYVKFLNNLMHPDPLQRMTAAQALEHPFMKNSLMETDKQRDKIFGKLLPDLAPPEMDPEPKDNEPVHQPRSSEVEDLVFESGLDSTSPKMQKAMKEIGENETQKGMETRSKAIVKEAQKDISAWKKKADKISRVPKEDPFRVILKNLGEKPWTRNDGKRPDLETKLDLLLTLRDLAEGWYDRQGREGVDTPEKEKGMTRKERQEKGLGLYKSDKKVEEALIALRSLIQEHSVAFREVLLMWEGFEE